MLEKLRLRRFAPCATLAMSNARTGEEMHQPRSRFDSSESNAATASFSTATRASPATRATPAEPGPSAETAVAQPGGRLIILRAANFGWNLALNLKIDGRTAANIVQGRRYDDFVPEGRHMLTVSAVPNYHPTSTVLNVRNGQTYVFTAIRQNTDSVLLVPSALPPGEPH